MFLAPQASHNHASMSLRKNRDSLSGALSVSLGLSSSYGSKSQPLEQSALLGRSYLGFNNVGLVHRGSRGGADDTSSIDYQQLATENRLHDQTAFLADDDEFYEEASGGGGGVYDNIIETLIEEADESSTLLNDQSPANFKNYYTQSHGDLESQPYVVTESSTTTQSPASSDLSNEKVTVAKVAGYVPSVILGLLLNILDGLSYGMIIFPIGEPIFSHLGSAGLSMFYISCIVSQLVYSLGGSAFGSGIGSEMIEVTPFFHTMAASITRLVGEENPDAVIATTITTYAISSMLTGVLFYLLGTFKLGQLVGFFPRHILIGCIGGVGYFLVITGIEISSKLGGFEYNWTYLSALLELSTLIKTSIPIILTVLLILLQHYNHNSLVLPSFFIFVFALTHLIILLSPQWDLDIARAAGYMFSAEGSSNAPWYDFYRLYDFKIVHWSVILRQVPSMLALTFFGVLHVPINVPALAVSTKQDDVDVDRELIAHGYSNFISGAIGSIQNYLVYTNSLLFIRAGADSRIAGVMLAIATFGVLIVGPVVIGFIPVCVVGSLIFLLGYELIKEALYDTIGRVNQFEYLTILVIVLTMGVYDFVIGIVVGIIIASFHFLYENTKIPIITNEYTGEVARSTVIRHPLQRQFLSNIGKQIYVLKLQSFLFFGSIGKVEKSIKTLFETDKYNENPIRYLILDFKNVLNVDFSAAEGFIRIKKFVLDHNAFLTISLGDKPSIINSLINAGIFESEAEGSELGKIQIFHDLNTSLEWCENEFLAKYKKLQTNFKANPTAINYTQIYRKPSVTPGRALPINTPRNTNFMQQARITYKKERNLEYSTRHSKTGEDKADPITDNEPLPLLLFALQGLSSKDQDYWSSLVKSFTKLEVLKDEIISIDSAESYFMLIESGIITITYKINDTANIYETYLPRTILGKFESDDVNKDRFGTEIKAKRDTTVWILKDDALKKLKEEDLRVYNELLLVLVGLNEERFENVTGYSLIST
jgi:SulP family sulfate permease